MVRHWDILGIHIWDGWQGIRDGHDGTGNLLNGLDDLHYADKSETATATNKL